MSYIGNQPSSVAFLTDTFSGNASATSFTLSAAPASTSSIIVAVSGVLQDPSTYAVTGTTLNFSAAPPTGTSNISVRFLGIPASGVTTTAYRTVTEFTATAGQTSFSVPSYTVGFIDVYRNGVMLGSADYTATNGTTVVLASGATVGDLVEVISMQVSSVLNAIPATAGSVGTTYLADSSVTTAKIAAGAVVQADLATGVAGTGPAFSAIITGGSQSISSNTYTKVQLGTELFDTNSNFDSTTNYRFTPTVAGYYQINASVAISWGSTSTTGGLGLLYKNGSAFYNTSFRNDSGNPMYGSCNINTLVYMNGTTDYLELFGYAVGGSGAVFAGTSGQNYQSWMNGYLARAV